MFGFPSLVALVALFGTSYLGDRLMARGGAPESTGASFRERAC